MARLSPVYSTPRPNKPLRLYAGDMTVGTNREAGSIRYEWRPWPRVRFCVPKAASYIEVGSSTINLNLAVKPANCTITDFGKGIAGSLNGPVDLGSPTGLSHILFHVPNLKHYFTGRKRVPHDQLTEDWEFDRMVMEAEGWRVTIEAVEDAQGLIESVKRRGGYVITHVGKLERSDGASFNAKDANELLSILTYFLSFVRGYWVNPIFPVGFDADGKRCWERWEPWRVDSWRHRPSWCDEHYGDSIALERVTDLTPRRWLPHFGASAY